MRRYWPALVQSGAWLLGRAGGRLPWLLALIVTIFFWNEERPRVTLSNATSDRVCWRNLGGETLDFTFSARQPFFTTLEVLTARNPSGGSAVDSLSVEVRDAESRKIIGRRIFPARKMAADGRFCKIQLGTQWRSAGRLYQVTVKTVGAPDIFRLGYEEQTVILREVYRSPWPVAAFWGWGGATLLLWLLRFRIRRICPVCGHSGALQRYLGEDTPWPWLLIHPLPLAGATVGGLGLAILIHWLTVTRLCTHLPFFVSGQTLFHLYDKCADMRFLWTFLGGTLLLLGGFAALNRRYHWVTSYGWSAERGLIPRLKHESLCWLILLGGGVGWALGRQGGGSGLAWGILGLVVLFGIWGWRGSRTVRHGIMAVLQLVLALGYLRLLAPGAQTLCGETLIPAAAAWWRYGVWGLLLIAWADVWWRWRRGRSVISPLAVAPFVFLLSPLGAGLAVSNDNYHYGERLVPYWSAITFGIRYFQDLILPHGWSDMVSAGLGAGIYGQNGNVSMALGGLRFQQLMNLGVFLSLFWSGLRLRAVVPVILACGILGGCNHALILGAVGALVILRLREMPFLQLGLYGVGSFLLAMYHTSIGVVTVCALLPLGGYLLSRCVWRTRSWRAGAKWGMLLLVAAGMLAVWGRDAWHMIDSTLIYAKVNYWAFGNEWYAYRLWPEMALSCLFWPLLLLLSVKYWLWYRLRNPALTCLLVVMLLVPLLIDNYTMGRIDFFFRRYWLVSGAYLGMLLPLAVYEARCHWPRFWRVAWSLLGILGGFWFVLTVGTGRHDVAGYRGETLRHWGAGTWMVQSDYQEYDRLRRAVPQGEDPSFLNLSNGGAIYHYLGKKPLIPYLAFYNIAAPAQEEECVKLLRRNGLPAVIYLGPEVINDGIKQMLRINRVMTLLLSSGRYRPVVCDGFDFLVRQPVSGPLNETELMLLDRMAGQGELGNLPRHYGASRLERLLAPERLPVIIGRSDKFLKIDFVTRGDYLLFRHVGKAEQDLVLRLTEYESELRFRCGPGERVIVPLTLMPSWLLYGPGKPGTFLLSSPSGEVAITDVEMRQTLR